MDAQDSRHPPRARREGGVLRRRKNCEDHPGLLERILPLRLAQEKLGYTIVLEKIDPQDWSEPGTEEIVQRVKDQRGDGNIILLHDAGGDRDQTVAALPQIIDYLQARGDRIVSLSELLRIPRDELMPPVDLTKSGWERIVASTGFRTWRGIVEFFWAFMIFSTGLVGATSRRTTTPARSIATGSASASTACRPPTTNGRLSFP